MPEMPEVEGLRGFLSKRLPGRSITRVELAAFAVLKTYAPPLDALLGLDIDAVNRHGKFLDIEAQGIHLVFHLARAGWLRWYDELPSARVRPSKQGIALRIGLDDGAGFDLTEAGTQRHLAVYVVSEPAAVPGIAALGPDPLASEFTAEDFAQVMKAAGRAQIKGVLRDQSRLAGIGNAYSDEVLFVAKLSPFHPVSNLTTEQRGHLFGVVRAVLGDAIAVSAGRPPDELKDAKRAHLRVHGRAGEPCDECGATIAQVSFADSSLQYCPGCQTGGKLLADRRMSRLLK